MKRAQSARLTPFQRRQARQTRKKKELTRRASASKLRESNLLREDEINRSVVVIVKERPSSVNTVKTVYSPKTGRKAKPGALYKNKLNSPKKSVIFDKTTAFPSINRSKKKSILGIMSYSRQSEMSVKPNDFISIS